MIHTNLGPTLRKFRKAHHYSIPQITQIMKNKYNISISPKTIYGWEIGSHQPCADYLLVLCKIYNITNILSTLGYDGDPLTTPLIPSAEEREIILKYRSHKYCNSAIRKLLDIPD